MRLDSTGRLLLPRQLISYGGIEREIVLFAYGNRIEIWARDAYEEMMASEPDDFSSLAEEVMGKVNQQPGGDQDDVSSSSDAR